MKSLLLALFGLAALALAVRERRRCGPLAGEGLIRAALLLALAVGLVLPALLGALRAAGLLLEALSAPGAAGAGGLWDGAWGALAAAAALVALLVALAREGPRRLGERGTLLAATLLAAAVKLAWVLLVRVEPVSDFGTMWRLCSAVAERGLGEVAASLPGIAHVYLERVLPYFLPLRLLFGPGALVYAVANVAAQLATAWIAWDLTRRWFGGPAARVTLLAALFAPEPLLAAGIPTHDIPGALFTLAALWVVNRGVERLAAGRTAAAMWAGAGFGLLAVVVDLQRTTGPFLLLPCGLVAVSAAGFSAVAGRRRRALLLAAGLFLALPYGLYRAADRALIAADLSIPPGALAARRAMVLAAGTDSWSDGSWGHFEFDYHLRYRDLPLDWRRLALTKLASDLRFSPVARLAHYTRKSRLLFDLGTQVDFYLPGAVRRTDGTPLAPFWRDWTMVFSRAWTVPFLVGLALACRRLARAPLPPLAAFLPLVHLATVAVLLVLFASVQPRYLYQAWAIGAIYLGLLVSPGERGPGGAAP